MDSGGNASGARPVNSVHPSGDAQPPTIQPGDQQLPVATPQAHPSRSAPLCKDCKHIAPADPLNNERFCTHPAQPVSLVSGRLVTACWKARSTRHAKAFGLTLCGEAGALFEPASPAA